jgi:hypothetical protein
VKVRPSEICRNCRCGTLFVDLPAGPNAGWFESTNAFLGGAPAVERMEFAVPPRVEERKEV